MATSSPKPLPRRPGGQVKRPSPSRPLRGLPRIDGRPAPPRWLRRSELLRRLRDARGARLVLVTAPAGYGKTTLLRQWAGEDPRPHAWLTLGRSHRRAPLLADAVARTLEPLAPGAPFVLVLDDAHLAAGALETVQALLAGLPGGAQIALGSRAVPGLPLGRLSAEGALLRVDATDLAFTRAEAEAVARAAGVEAEAGDLDAILEAMEGWPAGVALALEALRGGGPGPAAADGPVAEYLEEELLADLPEGARELMARTSVLERLSGPLCDALLGREGSGALLRDLERGSRFLVPLDPSGEWYRWRRPAAAALRRELRRSEPELEAGLHRRASAWLEATGDRAAAVAHARAAGDLRRAGELIWAAVPALLSRGSLGTLTDWLGGFADDEIAACPPLALAAAWCAVERRTELVEHWTWAAGCAAAGEPGPAWDAASVEPAIALLRAVVARDGVARMAEDAARASRLEAEGSPWRTVGRSLEGVARGLLGERGEARRLLEEGARRAGALLPSVRAQCLARLALLAGDEGDWDRAAGLAARARAAVEEYGLEGYASLASLHAISALALARTSGAGAPRADALRARHLLEGVVDIAPWLAVETRLILAQVDLLAGDAPAARAGVLQAGRLLPEGEDAPALLERLEAVRRAASGARSRGSEVASLTTAEIRVLQFLPTNLSFREIAGRLYVSRFTVKSQALSVYRKLSVSSRTEAVERARALGLVRP
jgi:LuxR family transcriptional regulator, maltose regulon positive regulatory protein